MQLPLLVGAPLGCAEPTVGTVSSVDPADACASVAALHAVGAKYDEDAGVFVKAAASCQVTVGNPGVSFYTLGSRVPDEQLPALERGVVGTGAARITIWRSNAVVVARDYNFQTPAGKLCIPQRLADGKIRCAPPTLLFLGTKATYFADAACQEPLVSTTEDCPRTSETITVQNAGDCGSGGVSEHQRGAAFSGTVYTDTTGTCVAASAPPDVSFFRVGAEIPVETFPEVVDVEL